LVTTRPATDGRLRLRGYIGLVGLAGGGAIAAALGRLPYTPNPAEWLAFGALALLTGAFAIKVPGIPVRISVSDTFFITSALLFGWAPATVAIAIDSLVMTVTHHRRQALGRVIFNVTGPALALWAGAAVFDALIDGGALFGRVTPADRLVVPLACLATVYYVLNSGLTAVAIALEKGASPFHIWRRHFAVISLNYFGAASVAFVLVVVAQYASLWAVAAVLPLFAVGHVALRSWMGRLEDAERHVATVDRLYLSTIEALSTAIEAKDGVTSSHIHRVQQYAMGLARSAGVTDELELKAIQAAALLHDTGKLAVPERILNKPGKLTDAEFETMKLHVDVGADILSAIDFPYPVVPIVRAHHENWDGTGYPRGLGGADIPVGARILSIVDCYDALTSDRPYRPALSDEEAMRLIRSMAGTKYDPALVLVFDRVRGEIAPSAERPPELQMALQQISRTVEPGAARPAIEPVGDASAVEALQALASMARVVGGRSTAADVAALAWSHLRHVVPGTSCAVYMAESATDTIVARFVAGAASPVLQGLRMKVGERLSGWVAGQQQSIVNSDAKLDLGDEAVLAGLSVCLATPLVHDACLVGVIALYGGAPFTTDHLATLETVAPHLALMLATVERMPATPAAEAVSQSPRPPALRVVASR
jgi:putative nucleotidyltransferase with HDIG domain